MVAEPSSDSRGNVTTAGGGECGERRGRVVGDDGQPESALLKVRIPALQLHELRLAERSPVGGTAEDEHQAAGSHERRQVACGARLIPAERESVVREAEQRVRAELDRREERVLAGTGDDRLLAEAAVSRGRSPGAARRLGRRGRCRKRP